MAFASVLETYIPLPYSDSGLKHPDHEAILLPAPIHIVTHESQLPNEFRFPSPETQCIIGFDLEGFDHSRYGTLCIMQLAFTNAIYLVDTIKGGKGLMRSCKPGLESSYITKVVHDCKRDGEVLYFQYGIKLHNVVDTQIAHTLIEEQYGLKKPSDEYISFVRLLAHPRYCGISYIEKEEVRVRMGQDPKFWTRRPLSELMIRAAADDVRFLLYVFHKMMEKLNERSLFKLAVRGALFSRCFCYAMNDTKFSDWPPLPIMPGYILDAEILTVVNIPSEKMGHVIGRGGASIRLLKECCKVDILIGGPKGPPGKVFIIGPVQQVKKAEALLRGRFM